MGNNSGLASTLMEFLRDVIALEFDRLLVLFPRALLGFTGSCGRVSHGHFSARSSRQLQQLEPRIAWSQV